MVSNGEKNCSAEGCRNGFEAYIEGKPYCHVHAPPLRHLPDVEDHAHEEFERWYGYLCIEWRAKHSDEEEMPLDEVIPGDVDTGRKSFVAGYLKGLTFGVRENKGVQEMLDAMLELRKDVI